ncbi:MAG: molybdopterin-synthase adenylyltransferase MoeB [Alphaproteobacteria bacterium]|nr:molybdopterin-synthase adenylyltransferase MoeB [Alphaproteobacteria bacterium]
MELTEEQFHRYARHLILDEVGDEGQEKLLASKVLVVGAGGLGAPLLMYLAAAGVGTLGVVDDDVVDLTNLQRQVVHVTDAVGQKKTDSAKATLASLNPGINVVTHDVRLTAENAEEIIGGYDLVADGSDNFETRYLLNDHCYRIGIPLIAAAMLRFEGQLFTFRRNDETPTACYRCIFPEAPPPEMVPRCEEAGILGALAGVMGSLQTTEVLKELLGLGESLAGRMVIYDALATDFHTIKLPRDKNCALCGDSPTIV